jgi:hypothetical protein
MERYLCFLSHRFQEILSLFSRATDGNYYNLVCHPTRSVLKKSLIGNRLKKHSKIITKQMPLITTRVEIYTI